MPGQMRAKDINNPPARTKITAIGSLLPNSSRLHRHDAEPNVVIPALRLEAQATRGAAGPAVVGPGAAAADAGIVAGAIPLRRGLRVMQIGVNAAGQFRVGPIAAPLEDVAVHIV